MRISALSFLSVQGHSHDLTLSAFCHTGDAVITQSKAAVFPALWLALWLMLCHAFQNSGRHTDSFSFRILMGKCVYGWTDVLSGPVRCGEHV